MSAGVGVRTHVLNGLNPPLSPLDSYLESTRLVNSAIQKPPMPYDQYFMVVCQMVMSQQLGECTELQRVCNNTRMITLQNLVLVHYTVLKTVTDNERYGENLSLLLKKLANLYERSVKRLAAEKGQATAFDALIDLVENSMVHPLNPNTKFMREHACHLLLCVLDFPRTVSPSPLQASSCHKILTEYVVPIFDQLEPLTALRVFHAQSRLWKYCDKTVYTEPWRTLSRIQHLLQSSQTVSCLLLNPTLPLDKRAEIEELMIDQTCTQLSSLRSGIEPTNVPLGFRADNKHLILNLPKNAQLDDGVNREQQIERLYLVAATDGGAEVVRKDLDAKERMRIVFKILEQYTPFELEKFELKREHIALALFALRILPKGKTSTKRALILFLRRCLELVESNGPLLTALLRHDPLNISRALFCPAMMSRLPMESVLVDHIMKFNEDVYVDHCVKIKQFLYGYQNIAVRLIKSANSGNHYPPFEDHDVRRRMLNVLKSVRDQGQQGGKGDQVPRKLVWLEELTTTVQQYIQFKALGLIDRNLDDLYDFIGMEGAFGIQPDKKSIEEHIEDMWQLTGTGESPEPTLDTESCKSLQESLCAILLSRSIQTVGLGHEQLVDLVGAYNKFLSSCKFNYRAMDYLTNCLYISRLLSFEFERWGTSPRNYRLELIAQQILTCVCHPFAYHNSEMVLVTPDQCSLLMKVFEKIMQGMGDVARIQLRNDPMVVLAVKRSIQLAKAAPNQPMTQARMPLIEVLKHVVVDDD